MIRTASFLVAWCLTGPVLAAELELRYRALERILAEQAFTLEGRRYVRGNAQAKCQFAYLESPRLGTEEGQLRMDARFSGRSAVDLFGKCLGMGDSFDLTLRATPVAKNGAIQLQDVRVVTAKDSFYIRRVRSALEQSFQGDFKIEVKNQAKRLLEQAAENAVYQQELTAFQLQEVRVAEDALVLVVDFRLVVK
jgi:hypothetical protein